MKVAKSEKKRAKGDKNRSLLQDQIMHHYITLLR